MDEVKKTNNQQQTSAQSQQPVKQKQVDTPVKNAGGQNQNHHNNYNNHNRHKKRRHKNKASQQGGQAQAQPLTFGEQIKKEFEDIKKLEQETTAAKTEQTSKQQVVFEQKEVTPDQKEETTVEKQTKKKAEKEAVTQEETERKDEHKLENEVKKSFAGVQHLQARNLNEKPRKEVREAAAKNSGAPQTFSLQAMQKARRRRKIIGWIIAAVLTVLFLSWLSRQQTPTDKTGLMVDQVRDERARAGKGKIVTVSGLVVTDGVIFESMSDRIAIYVMPPESDQFQDTGIRLVPGESQWRFSQAQEGTLYSVQAVILSGERVVAYSNTAAVTAPAGRVVLTFAPTPVTAETQVRTEPQESGEIAASGLVDYVQ